MSSVPPMAPGGAPKRKSVQYPPPSPSGRASRSGSEAGDDIKPFAAPTPASNNTASPASNNTAPPASNNTAPPASNNTAPPASNTAPPASSPPKQNTTDGTSAAPPPPSGPGTNATKATPPPPAVVPSSSPQRPSAAASSSDPMANSTNSTSDPAASQGVSLGGPGGPRRVVTVRPNMSSVTGVDRFAVIPKLQGGADRLRERVSSSLHNLLLDRCPERLDRHEEILDQYAGKERELLEFMMTLFGDEVLAGPRPDVSIISSGSGPDGSFTGGESSPHKPRGVQGTNTTAMLDEEVDSGVQSYYQNQSGTYNNAGMESLSRLTAGRASNVGAGRTCLVTPPVPKELLPHTPTSTSRQGPN